MPKPKFVYIAGPISHGNMIQHTRHAILVAEDLIEVGILPYVPHMSIFWDFLRPHSKEWWLRYDYGILERCDALLRLPGESEGADMEVGYATEHKIPVFYCINELKAWANGTIVDA